MYFDRRLTHKTTKCKDMKKNPTPRCVAFSLLLCFLKNQNLFVFLRHGHFLQKVAWTNAATWQHKLAADFPTLTQHPKLKCSNPADTGRKRNDLKSIERSLNFAKTFNSMRGNQLPVSTTRGQCYKTRQW